MSHTQTCGKHLLKLSHVGCPVGGAALCQQLRGAADLARYSVDCQRPGSQPVCHLR